MYDKGWRQTAQPSRYTVREPPTFLAPMAAQSAHQRQHHHQLWFLLPVTPLALVTPLAQGQWRKGAFSEQKNRYNYTCNQ